MDITARRVGLRIAGHRRSPPPACGKRLILLRRSKPAVTEFLKFYFSRGQVDWYSRHNLYIVGSYDACVTCMMNT